MRSLMMGCPVVTVVVLRRFLLFFAVFFSSDGAVGSAIRTVSVVVTVSLTVM